MRACLIQVACLIEVATKIGFTVLFIVFQSKEDLIFHVNYQALFSLKHKSKGKNKSAVFLPINLFTSSLPVSLSYAVVPLSCAVVLYQVQWYFIMYIGTFIMCSGTFIMCSGTFIMCSGTFIMSKDLDNLVDWQLD